MLGRMLRHLWLPDWWRFRVYPAASLTRIEAAVAAAEAGCRGEIRVAIEAALDFPALWSGCSARTRALALFSDLRVWDTEDNDGVLLYVLLADRDVEIVADRGAAARVAPEAWEAVCSEMEDRFRIGEHEAAILVGMARIGELLAEAEASGPRANGLPNRPTLIRR